MRAALAVVLLLAGSSGALAQTAPPTGPIVGGQKLQPTRSGTAEKEQRDGVAPSSAQAGADQRGVDQLGQTLLQGEKTDPPFAHVPPPPTASR